MAPHGATSEAHGTEEVEPLTREAPPPGQDGSEELELDTHPATQRESPPSWRERAQTFAIEYGRVGVATHLLLSLLWFLLIYTGVSSGLDIPALLDSVGLSLAVSDSTTNSAGSLVLAYAIYKLLTPLRWVFTLAVMPLVVRTLRRSDYMRAASSPSSPQPLPDT